MTENERSQREAAELGRKADALNPHRSTEALRFSEQFVEVDDKQLHEQIAETRKALYAIRGDAPTAARFYRMQLGAICHEQIRRARQSTERAERELAKLDM